MKFASPRTDFAFKKIFGAESSKDILISFLNSVLNLDIKEIDILDPYQAPVVDILKESIVDVRARIATGETFIIEMQVLNQGGFRQRVMYNTMKAYVNQLKASEEYHKLKPVIGLTITDFIMFEDSDNTKSNFQMIEKDRHETYHNDLELVFIELPKFKKNLEELGGIVEKWYYFMKHTENLDIIPENLGEIPEIKHALEIANFATFTPKELEIQENKQRYLVNAKYRDYEIKEKGRKEGHAQGREEGRAEQLIDLFKKGVIDKETTTRELSQLQNNLSKDAYTEYLNRLS